MKKQVLALGLVSTLAGCFGSLSSSDISSSTPISSVSSVASSIVSSISSVESSSVSSVSSEVSSSVSSSVISSSSVSSEVSSSTSLVSVVPYSELMTLSMTQMMDSTRFEMGMSIHLKTEEMEIFMNPLLRVQFYDDGIDSILHAHYYNKIIEGLGLHAFDFYADFTHDMIYHNDSQVWGAEGMTDFMTNTGLINVVNAQEIVDFDFLLATLRAGFMDFEAIDYLGAESVHGVTADHYRVHYDLMDTFQTIFDYLNANENLTDINFIDFNDFLTQTNLLQLVPIFEDFTIESYLHVDTDEVVRLGIDLAYLLDSVVTLYSVDLTAMVQEQFPNADVSILASYIEQLEIGVDMYQLDTLPLPVIPQEAIDSYIPPVVT